MKGDQDPTDLEMAGSLSNEISLSWLCAFCGQLRVFAGGRPFHFRRLDTCDVCESRVATKAADPAAVIAMIYKHLL